MNPTGDTHMIIRNTVLTIALGIATLTGPASAGGPIIAPEDIAEAEPLVRSHNNKLVPILFGLAVAAILLSGGGHDAPCHGDVEPTPEPGPGC